MALGETSRLRKLQGARYAAYGTVALIAVTVLCLAYAFVSHDFRLRYVAHYSDRSMDLVYLFTALWGGQDGSILWWLFLMSLYIGACVKFLGQKHVELQPYVIATLMAIVLFFCVLMTYAANPFSTSPGGARSDGEGLNPLLQNFYMIIHPPSLYVGFVGCSIPFAFCISALVTGRLDAEWIKACRKFTLFAWMFLAIGNTLGMLWAYVELGWGGYWAWDPVENAAFMPFLVITAFLHSVMIQERRGMFKLWNVALICLTFFMTIFGTFLTRSGAIASVHSFAQSGIGTYFVGFMGLIFAFCISLILYRWPELRGLTPERKLRVAALVAGWTMIGLTAPGIIVLFSKSEMSFTIKAMIFMVCVGAGVFVGVELVFRRLAQGSNLVSTRPHMESVLSREFTFILNNVFLLIFLVFVAGATTFPMITEALWNERVTIGPPFYNIYVQPLGLLIFIVMGVGTLFGWKKTSDAALRKAFVAPTVATALAVVLHLAFGKMLGFPAYVRTSLVQGGVAMEYVNAVMPLCGVAVFVFNVTVIAQEYFMLARAREKVDADSWWTRGAMKYVAYTFGLLITLVRLPAPGRRRYGGYFAHFGLVCMLLGFTGQSWNKSWETTLAPGQSFQAGSYSLKYDGYKREIDTTKKMDFATLTVTQNGKYLGEARPAKFMYKKMPESPTTEISVLETLSEDLYVVVGNINKQTNSASFQIHVNPLVRLIWWGCILLVLGSLVCMFPDLVPGESRAWQAVRTAGAVAGIFTLSMWLALAPTQAFAQQTSSMHSGTVHIEDEKEREVFQSLRCMCGGCQRLPLSTCGCGEADETRASIRTQMQAGKSKQEIMDTYAAKFGTEGLQAPPNRGALRSIYLLPFGVLSVGTLILVYIAYSWRKGKRGGAGGLALAGTSGQTGATSNGRDQYDARLEDELRDLDG
jgi:cytochrome c-type biogenesis protein CcmF